MCVGYMQTRTISYKGLEHLYNYIHKEVIGDANKHNVNVLERLATRKQVKWM